MDPIEATNKAKELVAQYYGDQLPADLASSLEGANSAERVRELVATYHNNNHAVIANSDEAKLVGELSGIITEMPLVAAPKPVLTPEAQRMKNEIEAWYADLHSAYKDDNSDGHIERILAAAESGDINEMNRAVNSYNEYAVRSGTDVDGVQRTYPEMFFSHEAFAANKARTNPVAGTMQKEVTDWYNSLPQDFKEADLAEKGRVYAVYEAAMTGDPAVMQDAINSYNKDAAGEKSMHINGKWYSYPEFGFTKLTEAKYNSLESGIIDPVYGATIGNNPGQAQARGRLAPSSDPVATTQAPPPPPPPELTRSEVLALYDKNNDGSVTDAELGGQNGLVGEVVNGKTTRIGSVGITSQQSVDGRNINNDIARLRNSGNAAQIQQAENLERFFATPENGGLTNEQRQNLVVATSLQNANRNNPNSASTDYLAQASAMTPAQRQFVSGIASSGMFGVGQQGRPIGYQPVASTNASPLSSLTPGRTGSADTLERQITGSSSADSLERSAQATTGATSRSIGGGSVGNLGMNPMGTTASLPSRAGTSIAAAATNATPPVHAWEPTPVASNSFQSPFVSAQPATSRSANADSAERTTSPAASGSSSASSASGNVNVVAGIDPRFGEIQNASGYSQDIKNKAMQAVREGDKSSAIGLLGYFSDQAAGSSAPVVHDSFQSPFVYVPPAPEPAPVASAAPVVHDAFHVPTPAPVAAPVPAPAPAALVLTALDHKINEINASAYSPTVKTLAIAAVQGGNDAPVSDILKFANGGSADAAAGYDPRQAQINAINANPFYNASVKNKAIELVRGGGYDKANVNDVMAYINGADINAQNVILGASVPTGIPPSASSRTPSVIPTATSGGGGIFRS